MKIMVLLLGYKLCHFSIAVEYPPSAKDGTCNSELQINYKLRYCKHLQIFKSKIHNICNSAIFAIPQLSAISQLSTILQLFTILIGRYL